MKYVSEIKTKVLCLEKKQANLTSKAVSAKPFESILSVQLSYDSVQQTKMMHHFSWDKKSPFNRISAFILVYPNTNI